MGSGTSSSEKRVPPCQVATFMALLVVERDEDAVAQAAVERLGEMALAGGVLDEDDLARADLARLAIARGDLHARVEADDVLAPRRGVPVQFVVGLDLVDDDPGRRQTLGRLARAPALGELDLDVPEMRLALRVDVEIVDPHPRPSLAAILAFSSSGVRRTMSSFWCASSL